MLLQVSNPYIEECYSAIKRTYYSTIQDHQLPEVCCVSFSEN